MVTKQRKNTLVKRGCFLHALFSTPFVATNSVATNDVEYERQNDFRGLNMRFYGRNDEIKSLRWQFQVAQENKVARMAVVTGRRRIGKTTLIQKAFEQSELPFIYLFISEMSSEEEIIQSLVSIAVKQLNIRFKPRLSNLAEVIEWLLDLSKQQPMVVVLDECQTLDKRIPHFWSELQHKWDQGKVGAQLLLIMSGSIQSTIERIFGNHNQPLFGRADQLMTVRPFSTSLVSQIFSDYGQTDEPKDLLLFYAITGGVARYIELLVDSNALTETDILQFLYSERGSWLRAEGHIMLANEFRLSAPLYLTILNRLATGRTKRTEIQDGIDTDISPYLGRLETLYGLISRQKPLFEEKFDRQTRYRISDPYMRFWTSFLSSTESQALIELQQWPTLIEQTQNKLSTFLGRTLEDWFKLRILESGHWDCDGSWWDRKGANEIDVIAINRINKRILFAEVKTNPKKYSEIQLRMKAQHFLENHAEFQNFEAFYQRLTPENMRQTF